MFSEMSMLFPKRSSNFKLSVTSDPVLITNVPVKMYIIRNMTPDVRVYIGSDTNVDASTGMPILGGEVMYFNTAASLYACISPNDDAADLRIQILS